MIKKVDSNQTLDGHQRSKKMNLIVLRQLRQQFYNLYIKRHNPIYQIFRDTLLPQSKTNSFSWLPIKSLFQIKKYKKTSVFGSEFFSKSPLAPNQKPFPDQEIQKNILLLAMNFSVSLLRISAASTVPLPGINPYSILSISTTSASAHPKSSHIVLKHVPITLYPYKSLN